MAKGIRTYFKISMHLVKVVSGFFYSNWKVTDQIYNLFKQSLKANSYMALKLKKTIFYLSYLPGLPLGRLPWPSAVE